MKLIRTLTLRSKLALAVISASSYWFLGFLAEQSEALDGLLSKANSGLNLIGALFGALVMAPYLASSDRRIMRATTMCISSAAIYYAAIRFVVHGPFGYETIIPFLISGGGAALLVSASVVLIAARRARWALLPMAAIGGALGGAVFEWSVGVESEVALIAGHLAWQVLVCVALHFGLRPSRERESRL